MNRSQIQDALRQEVVMFTFTKVNGEKRVMTGTLNSGYIPKELLPVLKEGQEPAKENESVVRCFDTGIQQWRSFRVDSLVSFDGKDITQAKAD